MDQDSNLLLKIILNKNNFKPIQEMMKQNISSIDQVWNYLYKNQSLLIDQKEKDMIELFNTINQYDNNVKKTLDIITKLTELGVTSKQMLYEVDQEDLNEIGFSKSMLEQKQLPEAFKNFIIATFQNQRIEETIQKLADGGIDSEDLLFQLDEKNIQKDYQIPKYAFRKWKDSHKSSESKPTKFSQSNQQKETIQNLIYQAQQNVDNDQIRKEKLKNLISKFQQTGSKNGLDYYQYPIYQRQELKDLQEYKTMIMIGQTGSGKTTLINFFLNYYLGVQFKDNFRLTLINEYHLNKHSSHSQTQDVIIYYVKPFNNNPGLRIIDTPGFGDTRGIQQDKIIADKIHQCFQTSVETLTTICFLVQSSNARLTINQNYILSQILQIFGKDVIQNFVFMFTFCDGGAPQAKLALEFQGDDNNSGCPIADLIPKMTQPWFLKFNSSAFSAPNKNTEGEDTDMTQLFWNIGIKSFEQLIQKLRINSDISLNLTRDVIQQRKTIMNVIQYLRKSIQRLLNLMDQHRATFNIIQKLDTAIIDSKNFIMPQKRYKIQEIRLNCNEYVTNCIKCNITCHYPCIIPDSENKDGCAAMSDGFCTICQNQCHWSVHKNNSFRYESIEYIENIELNELKKQYLQSESQKSQKEQILDGIEYEYDQACIECMDQQSKLMNAMNRLNEIALQPAVFKHQEEYLELMIHEEQTKKELGWKERVTSLEDMKEDWKIMRETYTRTGQFELTQTFYKDCIKTKKQQKKGCIAKIFS